jgi:hypothetical protein
MFAVSGCEVPAVDVSFRHVYVYMYACRQPGKHRLLPSICMKYISRSISSESDLSPEEE